jgi:hypothetical protein
MDSGRNWVGEGGEGDVFDLGMTITFAVLK